MPSWMEPATYGNLSLESTALAKRLDEERMYGQGHWPLENDGQASERVAKIAERFRELKRKRMREIDDLPFFPQKEIHP